jgi:PTS system mannitol-specific IIA component
MYRLQKKQRIGKKPFAWRLHRSWKTEVFALLILIHNVEVNGPYIVIMPDVAMPHSRVEDGALKTDASILKLKDGVIFPQDNVVHLIIALSANDNDAHMQLLSDMVDVFMDEDKMNALLHAECVEEIRRVLI